MLFHRNSAEQMSAPDLDAETTEDRKRMVPNPGVFDAGALIPLFREFGALVAYRNGRGVVLYDGELLVDGAILVEGEPAAIAADARVRAVYLGDRSDG